MGETPSLGRAIVDFLDSEGVPSRYTARLDPTGRDDLQGVTVIIAAANTPYCATLRAQLQGHLNGQELVVVGSRDSHLTEGPRVHVVGLPLDPTPFLSLVRSLAA